MSHCPAAKPRVATGLRERGLLSTAQVQCGKNGEFDGVYFAWLYLFIYIVVALYSYMFIYLYRYFAIFLLLNCMLKHGSIAFFISIVLIRYSIFRNGPFFRLLIITGITVVAVFLSFIELSYYLFLISW